MLINGSYDILNAEGRHTDFMVVYLKLVLKGAAVAAFQVCSVILTGFNYT